MPKPEGGKTKALVEYMNYYAIEKSVFRMINKVWSNNTSIHSDILNANWIPIELKARMALVMRAKQASDPLNNQRRICRLIRDEYSRNMIRFMKKLPATQCQKNATSARFMPMPNMIA